MKTALIGEYGWTLQGAEALNQRVMHYLFHRRQIQGLGATYFLISSIFQHFSRRFTRAGHDETTRSLTFSFRYFSNEFE
jgi:hypothetical protein